MNRGVAHVCASARPPIELPKEAIGEGAAPLLEWQQEGAHWMAKWGSLQDFSVEAHFWIFAFRTKAGAWLFDLSDGNWQARAATLREAQRAAEDRLLRALAELQRLVSGTVASGPVQL